MTVYDYRYKAWEGERRGPLWRWMAIPRFAYMELFKTRLLTAALMLSMVSFAGAMTVIYLYANPSILKLLYLTPRVMPPINGYFFYVIINLQLPTCLLLAFMGGSGLIARDLRHNAVVLYASKPISRWEYLLGKFGVLFFIDGALLCVGPLALFLLQVVVADEKWRGSFWQDYAAIGPAIVAYGLACAVTLTLLILAASSLTDSPRYAGAAFVVFLIGTELFTTMLAGVTGEPRLLVFAPLNAVMGVGFQLFHVENKMFYGPVVTWLVILGYWALSLWIIHWRVSRRSSYGR